MSTPPSPTGPPWGVVLRQESGLMSHTSDQQLALRQTNQNLSVKENHEFQKKVLGADGKGSKV